MNCKILLSCFTRNTRLWNLQSICPMAEMSTAKTARQPYDTIPKPPSCVMDRCTRAFDLVISGMNERLEDPKP